MKRNPDNIYGNLAYFLKVTDYLHLELSLSLSLYFHHHFRVLPTKSPELLPSHNYFLSHILLFCACAANTTLNIMSSQYRKNFGILQYYSHIALFNL